MKYYNAGSIIMTPKGNSLHKNTIRHVHGMS